MSRTDRPAAKEPDMATNLVTTTYDANTGETIDLATLTDAELVAWRDAAGQAGDAELVETITAIRNAPDMDTIPTGWNTATRIVAAYDPIEYGDLVVAHFGDGDDVDTILGTSERAEAIAGALGFTSRRAFEDGPGNEVIEWTR